MAQAGTVGSFALMNLDYQGVTVFPNFNWSQSIRRAIKLFFVSFAGYETLSPQLFDRHLQQLIMQMNLLYVTPIPDQTAIDQIRNNLNNESMAITVGVKKMKGRGYVTEPMISLVCNNITANAMIYPLDVSTEVQDVKYECMLNFANYRDNRLNNSGIRIVLQGNQWSHPEQQLLEFQINYSEIHAEGFEDWINFGRGVLLLIKIEFKIVNEKRNRFPV